MKIEALIAKIIGKKTATEMFDSAVDELKAESENISVELANNRFENVKNSIAEKVAEFTTAFDRCTYVIAIYPDLDKLYVLKDGDANWSDLLVNTSFSGVGEVYDSVLLRERYYEEVHKLMVEFGFTYDGWRYEKNFDMTKKKEE